MPMGEVARQERDGGILRGDGPHRQPALRLPAREERGRPAPGPRRHRARRTGSRRARPPPSPSPFPSGRTRRRCRAGPRARSGSPDGRPRPAPRAASSKLRVAVEDQGDEDAVPAVDRRAAERLVHDGHDALARPCRGIRPGAARSIGRGRGSPRTVTRVTLFAARPARAPASAAPSRTAGLSRTAPPSPQRSTMAWRPLEQGLDVGAHERRGQEAEEAERRVAAPDGRGVQEGPPETRARPPAPRAACPGR